MDTERPPSSSPNPLRFTWTLLLFLALGFGSCKKEPEAAPGGAEQAGVSAPPAVEQKALAKFDADGDGILSNAEREKMKRIFVEHFDTDGDNKLSDKEREVARRRSKATVVTANPRVSTPESAAVFLSRFDSDGDGKLSPAEAGETRWKVMSRSDTNKDGLISPQEWYAANYRRQKARVRQRKAPSAPPKGR